MSWRDKRDKEKKPKPEFPFDFFNTKDFFGSSIFDDFMKEISQIMSQRIENDSEMEVKEFGPYIWGYSMTMGPDGKPIVKQYSNTDQLPSFTQRPAQIEEKTSEPLMDVFTDDEHVKLIIEMPGINKEDVHVTATERKVSINAKTNDREYSTVKELEAAINPKKYETKFNNGVLELTFQRIQVDEEEEFEVDIV